jgi:hypothetical protein
MQNSPVQRLCVRCKAALQHNQPFCSICGIQQPQMTTPTPKKSGLSAWSITTLVLVCSIVGSCGLCGLFGAIVKTDEKQQTSLVNTSSTPTSTPTPTVKTSPTPEPIGSLDARLQVAADVRHYLRDQDIPASVVASGTTLNVTYNYALMDYDPDTTFFKQQGKQGLKKMANAGFETLEIEANDKSGQTKKRTFSLIEYRK